MVSLRVQTSHTADNVPQGEQTSPELALDLVDLSLDLPHSLVLAGRDRNILHRYSSAGAGTVLTQAHDLV